MAEIDIKSLGVFGPNNAINKIKRHYQDNEQKLDNVDKKLLSSTPSEKSNVTTKNKNIVTGTNPKGAGAPVRQFDRIYAAKAPLKLSSLLNATSRNIVEKYETGLTRDELLRKALDEYIKQNMSLEDKQELYNTVIKDLNLFRKKYPTVPETDKDKNVIRSAAEIEQQTTEELKARWGISR